MTISCKNTYAVWSVSAFCLSQAHAFGVDTKDIIYYRSCSSFRHDVKSNNVPIPQIALPTSDVGETGSISTKAINLHCLQTFVCVDLLYNCKITASDNK